MARAKKKGTPPETDDKLNAKRELFCHYYAQNSETFGNGTLSYAAAYGYELDTLSKEAVYEEIVDEETGEIRRGELIEASEYDKAANVCAVEAGRLLRTPHVQKRVTALLNELLKDEVVDGELARVIQQNVKLDAKVAAIREYNKLRGRIIDKTQNLTRLPFGESDLSVVIATLPQERQDYFYGIIRDLIEEAELRRRATATEGGGSR
jgi:hypothetical protein